MDNLGHWDNLVFSVPSQAIPLGHIWKERQVTSKEKFPFPLSWQ